MRYILRYIYIYKSINPLNSRHLVYTLLPAVPTKHSSNTEKPAIESMAGFFMFITLH